LVILSQNPETNNYWFVFIRQGALNKILLYCLQPGYIQTTVARLLLGIGEVAGLFFCIDEGIFMAVLLS
jgi:hypothetical protein